MDYTAEQEMEVEALQAILMDEFQEEEARPDGWPPTARCYQVDVTPPPADGVDGGAGDSPVRLQLLFAHTPSYPDEPPLLKVRSVRGMGPDDVRAVEALVREEAQANLGMAMVYTLVQAAQEWLREKVAGENGGAEAELDPEEARKAAEAAEEARLAAARAHGTPVTPATFAAWKAKFDAEAALASAGLGEDGGAPQRLSGKQWFLQHEAAGEQEEDEEDYDFVDEAAEGVDAADNDEDDLDYEDDDDEGLLDEYGA